MNLNFLPMFFSIQESSSDILEEATSIIETEQISMWQLIWGYDSMTGDYSITSLVVMSLLFLFSFIAIYVFIERFMAVQRALKGEKDFMQKITGFVKAGNLNEAKDHCKSSDNPIARMIEKGISRVGRPMKDITTSIENVGKLEISRLERRLSMLATISGVAPMLGFLGTVLGMVKVFQNMSKEKTFEIASLSGGIMEAMITTVGGLIVGIVAYVAYNYLVSKVEKVIHNMEGHPLSSLIFWKLQANNLWILDQVIKSKIEGGMSSMTDLVFSPLIFFIVISTMITAGINIDVPKNGGKSSNKKILSVNINDKNEYFINKKKTAITSEDIEAVILKNIGNDSIISLYGSEESSWEATVYVIDIAKQNNFKISLNGNRK